MTSIRSHEISELFQKLLPSQKEFLWAPESMAAIAGGVGSGKSHAGVLRGLMLSAAIPGNRGLMSCFRGSDLEDRLVPLFEELCPSSWIKTARKKPSRVYILRNNSVIMFKHLHDAHSATKTGRLGLNLGWFFISQLEECLEEHWNALLGRLRWPKAPKKYGFADLNPNGRDWTWEKFFQGAQNFPKDEDGKVRPINGKLHQILRPRRDTLGIVVDSEENRISNGGFVEDAFFDRMLENYGEVYTNRYVHASFDDLHGKLFPDFEAGLIDDSIASVHNIEVFPIPRHWECVTGIDVGGDSPWAVVPIYSDEKGNLIVTKGFDRRTGRVAEVADWIKRNTPYNESRTRHVIDPENKIASQELADYGVHCQVAQKSVLAGILRLEGRLHVNKALKLPYWYEETQTKTEAGMRAFLRHRSNGSPRLFVMKDALTWRKEFNTAKWNPTKPDEMFKSATARWDQVEATIYVSNMLPEPSKPRPDDKYERMAEHDPLSAKEARAFDRRLAALSDKMKGRGGRLQACEEEEFEDDPGEQAVTRGGGDDF